MVMIKIKEGITQDNQEEAKKVYAAASRLEYIEKIQIKSYQVKKRNFGIRKGNENIDDALLWKWGRYFSRCCR